MQQSTAGAGSGSSGGDSLGRGAGLVRFRSAPATWLEALLEDDLVRDDPIKLGHNNPGGLTQLLTAGTIHNPGPSHPPPLLHTSTSSAATTANASAAVGGRNSEDSYLSSATDPCFFDSGGDSAGAGVHSSNLGFQRMNSSPADFLSGSVDGYFSSFGIPSGNYDYMGSSGIDISPSGKRLREDDSAKFGHQLKEEQGTGAGSLLDLDLERMLEDSVPCRVRAKRGCATHPRSIAERVRRTRISDRIRKLQELVPNMDKQTNTADMLEEAVEYVKGLQKQIEELMEHQKKCKCMAKN